MCGAEQGKAEEQKKVLMKGDEAAFFSKGFTDYYKQNANITSDSSKLKEKSRLEKRESWEVFSINYFTISL